MAYFKNFAGARNDQLYNLTFTKKKIKIALRSARDVTPGPDNFRLFFLHYAPEVILEEVLSTLNQIWTRGDFPTQ